MNRNSLNQTIKLNDGQKEQIIGEIRDFYLNVRDEEIGIIEEQQMDEIQKQIEIGNYLYERKLR